MDFGLSEDQQLLEDNVRRFLADRVPITRVRELRDAGTRNDRDVWSALSDMGATGILVPEAHGGSGLSLLNAALVAQALGRAVTPSAYLGAAVMAPVALRELAGDASGQWLAGIASGELLFGVAATQLFSIREGAGVSLKDGTLHGKALMAIDAGGADLILVALADGGLAVVTRDAAGLTLKQMVTVDATRCTSELICDGVRAETVFENAGPALRRMLQAGRIALAADELGACESMIEQAVSYSADRKQFDRVIGSFQAVKHMCAEMVAELEPARALIWYAAHSFDALPDETPLMACHALSHVSEIGRDIASVATQVHGGIGWTDEQNLHFWFKRIGTARHLLGGPELLREEAARLQGLAG